MKNFYLFLILLLVISSCQKDENELVIDSSQTLTKTSSLSNLVERVTQNPTTKDNVLDDTSCFSVQLPVTVTVNGQQVNVTDQDDYQYVKDIKDQYANDNDIVYFNYPITVIKKNYSTQVITNYTDFNNVKAQCGSDDGLNEINCISINFPISINVYNSNNQILNTLNFDNNNQVYNYFATLNYNDYVALVYPISITGPNGQNIIITSNSELESYIESVISICNDDNSGNNQPELLATLTSGSWFVSYCFYDNLDKTYYYSGYTFTFNANGTAVAVKNSTTINGTWQIEVNGSEKKLDLNFDGDTLDKIEEDWKVIEFTSSIIRTRHGSGGNGDNDYLTLTKNQ